MRIGIVTTSYPTSASDSTGTFVRTRALELARDGHQVDVICARHGDDNSGQEHPAIRVTRIDAGAHLLFGGPGAPEVIEAARGPDRFRVWAAAAAFFGALSTEIRRSARTWERVESHWLVPCGLAVVMAAPGVRHGAYAHSGDVAGLERWPGGRLAARLVLQHATEVTCVSQDLKARLTALGSPRWSTRVLVRSMPVAAHLVGPRPGASATAGERATVIGVGRLVPIKGFDRAILALGKMASRTRPRLVLLGEGPERGRLMALARACRVEMDAPGRVAPAEVARHMSMADVAIVPSRVLRGGRTEGAPLAAREALACGIPLIASAVGGLCDLEGSPGVHLVAPEGDLVAPLTRVLAMRGPLALGFRPRAGPAAEPRHGRFPP